MIQTEHVDFIAQPVSELQRAEEFYGGVLGLMRNPHSGARWVEYEPGNLTLGLSTFGGGVALRVDDVPAARAKLEEGGLAFSMDTFDSGVCNGAPFTDPDGNRLLLHRRYAPEETWELETTDVERTDFVGINVTGVSVNPARSISERMNFCASSGVPPTKSTPWLPSRSRTSGSCIALLISAFSFVTTGAGVPAGA